jgi:hypothetical protein
MSKVKNGGYKEPLLNTVQKSDLANRIIDWRLEGKPRSEMLKLIDIYSPVKLSESGAKGLIDHSTRLLEECVQVDAKEIVPVHLLQYEHIFSYYQSIGNVSGMNAAMKAKERLVGLFKKDRKVVINKKTNVVINRDVKYDISHFSIDQQNSFKILLAKAS